MRTRDDVEAYLLRSRLPYEEIGHDLFLVHDRASGFDVVVKLDAGLVVLRVKVLDLAGRGDRTRLYEELLRLNATDVVHGAYGLVDDSVVLTCSLRLESLDYEELQGVLDDFSLSLTKHHARLAAANAA